jgi:hypothetical protein
MRDAWLAFLLAGAGLLGAAGCGKDAAAPSCAQVEQKMRTLTKPNGGDLSPGAYEAVCQEQKFSAARRSCTMKAKRLADLRSCKDL